MGTIHPNSKYFFPNCPQKETAVLKGLSLRRPGDAAPTGEGTPAPVPAPVAHRGYSADQPLSRLYPPPFELERWGGTPTRQRRGSQGDRLCPPPLQTTASSWETVEWRPCWDRGCVSASDSVCFAVVPQNMTTPTSQAWKFPMKSTPLPASEHGKQLHLPHSTAFASSPRGRLTK